MITGRDACATMGNRVSKMADLTTIATQGHFGTATDRIVALATQGHYDELLESQVLLLTIGVARHSGGIVITKRNAGTTATKHSDNITIDSWR